MVNRKVVITHVFLNVSSIKRFIEIHVSCIVERCVDVPTAICYRHVDMAESSHPSKPVFMRIRTVIYLLIELTAVLEILDFEQTTIGLPTHKVSQD